MGTSKRFDAPVKVGRVAEVFGLSSKPCACDVIAEYLQIRVPRAFLPGSKSPSKSPTKGGLAASVTGTCFALALPGGVLYVSFIYMTAQLLCVALCAAGSTKAGIQASLSPQPAPGQVVTSSATDATEHAQVEPLAERYCFDPANTGSYPPKPALAKTIDGVHDSQSQTFAPSASAIDNAVEQAGKSANDARALEMPFKHNRALPLELFDNPETEVVPPEDRISNRASDQPGASARSRFYDSKGAFAWAPCFVIAYDR